MKLLLYDMSTYTQRDIMDALSNLGIEYKNVLYKLADVCEDAYFEKCIAEILEKDSYDAVFSVNYFPILAKICNRYSLPYLSWSYDSPITIREDDTTVPLDTNFIFLFDRVECGRFAKKGAKHVFHLPLAVNTGRLDKVQGNAKKYANEIAMVGQLYDTSVQGLLLPLGQWEQGYISAIAESQLTLYGGYILGQTITEDLINRMNQAYKQLGTQVNLSREGFAVSMAKYITHMERVILLETLSEAHEVALYSPATSEELPKVKWKGSAGYFDEMPLIFRNSAINLNISLKCIQSGIPLRTLDILGSGGFLLSNWQQEIAENFVDGEEVVMYSSIEEAVDKCDYYLKHETERKKIALAGYQKVQEAFRYEERIKEMLTAAGLLL